MAERTIHQLVQDVHTAAVALGMDVSPKDVGFIITEFLHGVIDDYTHYPLPNLTAAQKAGMENTFGYIAALAEGTATVKDEE